MADHPALSLPGPERVEYLVAVSSIAHADQAVDDAELERVRALCAALEISKRGTDDVLASLRAPDPARVARAVARYRQHDLRFTLLTDAVTIVFADGRVDPAEAEEIASFAAALDVSVAQATLIARYVQTVIDDRPGGEALAADLAEKLGQAGIDAPARGAIRWLYVKFRGGKDQKK